MPKRERSTTAPQALALLNSELAMTASKAFCERIERSNGSEKKRIDEAFRLTLGRYPTADEAARATVFLKSSPLSELGRALLFGLAGFAQSSGSPSSSGQPLIAMS